MDDNIGLVKAPRLCVMGREASGYGFNLHGEKGVIGQYISAVDPGGPADKAGMCVGDRVVEVNGVNVESQLHGEVVSAIRSNPEVTRLLVVDKITDSYLKEIYRPVTADLVGYSSVHEMNLSEAETQINEQPTMVEPVELSNEPASGEYESEVCISEEEKGEVPIPAVTVQYPEEGLDVVDGDQGGGSNVVDGVEACNNDFPMYEAISPVMHPQIEKPTTVDYVHQPETEAKATPQEEEVPEHPKDQAPDNGFPSMIPVQSRDSRVETPDQTHVNKVETHDVPSMIPVQSRDSRVETPNQTHVNKVETHDVPSMIPVQSRDSRVETPDQTHINKVETHDEPHVSAVKALEETKKAGSIMKKETQRVRPSSLPKRKQVKEGKSDWKAKNDLFNNL